MGIEPGAWGQLGADLAATFPALGAVTPERVLGRGFRSVVIATREGWAFRIAQNAAGTAGQARAVARLADPVLPAFTPALVHGDLWYENLLVDPAAGRLLGVLDWEDAHVGDPAQDFATLRHLGAAFAGQVVAATRAAAAAPPAAFAHRVQRLWELREFDGLAFALQMHDADELADALRKLRAGPILGRG